jgi:hypothetical protein
MYVYDFSSLNNYFIKAKCILRSKKTCEKKCNEYNECKISINT